MVTETRVNPAFEDWFSAVDLSEDWPGLDDRERSILKDWLQLAFEAGEEARDDELSWLDYLAREGGENGDDDELDEL